MPQVGLADKGQPVAAGGQLHRGQDVAHRKEDVGLIPRLLKELVRNLAGALVGALEDKPLVPQALQVDPWVFAAAFGDAPARQGMLGPLNIGYNDKNIKEAVTQNSLAYKLVTI